MSKNKKKRPSAAHRTLPPSRRKFCPFKEQGITRIDYKDIELLKGYITECGKIVPRRISGVSAPYQRKLQLAIKQARNIGLLSFADGYVSPVG